MGTAAVHCLGICVLLLAPVEAAATDPVVDTKEVLSKGNYPWYDPQSDDVRGLMPPQLPPPPEPAKPSEPTDPNRISLFTWLIWFLFAALVGFLLFQLITGFSWFSWKKRDSEAEEVATTVDRLEALPVPVRRVGDFLAEATRCVEAGNYNDAVVFFYAHLLVRLDQHGWIRLAKGKTNRQYVRELRDRLRRPSGDNDLWPRDFLFAVVVRFESAFFGGRTLTADQFLPLWEQRDRFQAWTESGSGDAN